MKDERVLVVIFFMAFVARDLWTLFPDSPETLCLNNPCPYDISPFPLSDQKIAKSSFNWLLGMYLSQLLMCFVPWAMARKARTFFNAALIIAACELAEYLINYNESWGFIYIPTSKETNVPIPVNVTTLRYPFFLAYSIRTLSSWS